MILKQDKVLKRDTAAVGLLFAMGIALAVTGGATLSGFATGALQAVVRSTGFGQGEVLQDEQRRQARSIATLDRKLAQLSEQIAGLARNTSVAAGSSETRAQGDIARLEADMTALREELTTHRTAMIPTPVTSDGPADPHGTALAQAGISILALRSSFDERDRARGAEIAAVARRIDRLEQMVIAQEATSSTTGSANGSATDSLRPHAAPTSRKRPQRSARPSWLVQPDLVGVSVVNEQGERFQVERGTRVPGLGRITAVRQQGDRWVVVTRHGLLVEQR